MPRKSASKQKPQEARGPSKWLFVLFFCLVAVASAQLFKDLGVVQVDTDGRFHIAAVDTILAQVTGDGAAGAGQTDGTTYNRFLFSDNVNRCQNKGGVTLDLTDISPASTPAPAAPTLPSTMTCELGDNLADYIGFVSDAKIDELAGLGYKYALALVLGDPGNADKGAAEKISRMCAAGMMPVIRSCDGSQCGFQNGTAQGDYLNGLINSTSCSKVYAVCGHNEPELEFGNNMLEEGKWTQDCVSVLRNNPKALITTPIFNGSYGDSDSVAQNNAKQFVAGYAQSGGNFAADKGVFSCLAFTTYTFTGGGFTSPASTYLKRMTSIPEYSGMTPCVMETGVLSLPDIKPVSDPGLAGEAVRGLLGDGAKFVLGFNFAGNDSGSWSNFVLPDKGRGVCSGAITPTGASAPGSQPDLDTSAFSAKLQPLYLAGMKYVKFNISKFTDADSTLAAKYILAANDQHLKLILNMTESPAGASTNSLEQIAAIIKFVREVSNKAKNKDFIITTAPRSLFGPDMKLVIDTAIGVSEGLKGFPNIVKGTPELHVDRDNPCDPRSCEQQTEFAIFDEFKNFVDVGGGDLPKKFDILIYAVKNFDSDFGTQDSKSYLRSPFFYGQLVDPKTGKIYFRPKQWLRDYNDANKSFMQAIIVDLGVAPGHEGKKYNERLVERMGFDFGAFSDDPTIAGVVFDARTTTDLMKDKQSLQKINLYGTNCNYDLANYNTDFKANSVASACEVKPATVDAKVPSTRVTCAQNGTYPSGAPKYDCSGIIQYTLQVGLPIRSFGSTSPIGTDTHPYMPISSKISNFSFNMGIDTINQFASKITGGGLDYMMPWLGSAINASEIAKTQTYSVDSEWQSKMNISSGSAPTESAAEGTGEQGKTAIDFFSNGRNLWGYSSPGNNQKILGLDERTLYINKDTGLDKGQFVTDIRKADYYDPARLASTFQQINACGGSVARAAIDPQNMVYGSEIKFGDTHWTGTGNDLCYDQFRGKLSGAAAFCSYSYSSKCLCAGKTYTIGAAAAAGVSCDLNAQQINDFACTNYTKGKLEYKDSPVIVHGTLPEAPKFDIPGAYDALANIYKLVQDQLSTRGEKLVFNEDWGWRGEVVLRSYSQTSENANFHLPDGRKNNLLTLDSANGAQIPGDYVTIYDQYLSEDGNFAKYYEYYPMLGFIDELTRLYDILGYETTLPSAVPVKDGGKVYWNTQAVQAGGITAEGFAGWYGCDEPALKAAEAELTAKSGHAVHLNCIASYSTDANDPNFVSDPLGAFLCNRGYPVSVECTQKIQCTPGPVQSGQYACPLDSGSCLKGPGVESHSSLPSAIDLLSVGKAAASVVAPFDGEIKGVFSGNDLSWCKNGTKAGGTILYQGTFNGGLTTLFMYHVHTEGLKVGTSYTAGSVISRLSVATDSDMGSDVANCWQGEHLHMEIINNNVDQVKSIELGGDISAAAKAARSVLSASLSDKTRDVAGLVAALGCKVDGTGVSTFQEYKEFGYTCQPKNPVTTTPSASLASSSSLCSPEGTVNFSGINCLIKKVAANFPDVSDVALKATMQRETGLTSDITHAEYTGDPLEKGSLKDNSADAGGPMQFTTVAWWEISNKHKAEMLSCLQSIGITTDQITIDYKFMVGPSLCAAAVKQKFDIQFETGGSVASADWLTLNYPKDKAYSASELAKCSNLGDANVSAMHIAAKRYYGKCIYDMDSCGNYCQEVYDFAKSYGQLECSGTVATPVLSQDDLLLYPVGRDVTIPNCQEPEPSSLRKVNTDRTYFPSDANDPGKTDFLLVDPAATALEKLLTDMKVQDSGAYATCGFNWGYRSAATQSAQPGKCGAGTACACHSEHQLGTAVDFRNADGTNVGTFASTACYNWLKSNAVNYGFIQSYTSGNPDYSTEPWHWRWLPGDNAAKFKSQSSYQYLRLYLDSIKPKT